MVKFEGFDENSKALHTTCITHYYSDLPMKGLGKNMENIGIGEPLYIPQSAAFDSIIWRYTEAEIERRAYELNAEVKWMELPLQNIADECKYLMWFSNSEQHISKQYL